MYRYSDRPSVNFLPADARYPPYAAAGCTKDAVSASYPQSTHRSAVRRDGLHTPPSDDMASTTFHQPPYGSYGSRQETYTAPTGFSTTTTLSRQVVSSRAPVEPVFLKDHTSPAGGRNTMTSDAERRRKSNSESIIPKLQIPSSVNDSGGSIAEFAAQITCLFWFESTETLRKAEIYNPAHSPIKRLVQAAIPSSGFRKWVVTILTTTQVTQNVILLALLFIYRLKTLNPTVQGKVGSEYRLLTVALMLGNKFLDDNTYTNKTWAEVSGISVGEIHVMEVEFLSNMRYSLFASKEEWNEWQVKLGKFWDYFEKASRVPLALPSPIPSSTLGHTALPSPPCSLQTSPPVLATPSPAPAIFSYSQPWSAPAYPPASLPSVPELDLPQQRRKRSVDEEYVDYPAKRMARPNPLPQVQSVITQPPMHGPASAPRHNVPRLPVPQLSISTSQTIPTNYPATTGAYGPQTMNQLPPLTTRAMSTVYTPHTPTWSQQMPLPTPGQNTQSGSVYNTPSRRTSPGSTQLPLGSSPTSATFPMHNHHSPSIFLQQRSSPYKPIRHVNTLLFPPPSGSMNAATRPIDQMHYQPLGKRNDYRSGVVPEYASHPAYQTWPVLPQPNFHI